MSERWPRGVVTGISPEAPLPASCRPTGRDVRPSECARQQHSRGKAARRGTQSKESGQGNRGSGDPGRRWARGLSRSGPRGSRPWPWRLRATERARLAKAVGCSVDEIAITRGATEALQVMIGGYNKLKPGDAVAYADLDYDSMQYAMNWLKERRGVDVITTAIPEPATYQNVIDHYTKLLSDNPRIKLLLLTHISHRTGLKVPISEISRMAAERGVDTVVDAAHSWGHVDFDVKDLNSPFVGFNLHKWIGAPLGCGFLYIQKDRLGDIDRHFADEDFDADDVRSRIHTGTANSANYLSIPAALDFHHAVGAANKFARLQYLRDRWVECGDHRLPALHNSGCRCGLNPPASKSARAM
ncbi:MAG: hypothetical protein DI613_16940 [Kocuria rhizophila]|nr:MAG: hypothetical protein DI613_16940 [Kocuria rhizophila]